MDIPTITIQDICKEIKSMKNKRCNIDDFSSVILKENAHLIASPLKFLFNQSLQQNKFPTSLKSAKVIPIYKKGVKSDMNNYRPISLINVFSKLFEKVIKQYLTNHMIANDILHPNQFGFQKGTSTLDALSAFSKKLYTEIEKNNSILSVFVDFSKAFDTVPHDILLRKLNFYGIRGGINN